MYVTKGLDIDTCAESKLRSRIGTMLGRRRQSIHGGFGPLAPPRSLGSFTRNLGSSHGQTLSPRASSHNLAEGHGRLSSLAERPTTAEDRERASVSRDNAKTSHEGTNGITSADATNDSHPPLAQTPSNILNGTAEDIFDAPASAQQPKPDPVKDAEGFTIPTSTNDPIAQAQREAAGEEPEQLFKLNIQNEPIAEEDQDAKQAALSNVANTLQMGMPSLPSRKAGTVRGRREVRNTIYMPSLPVPENSSELTFPPSPSLPTTASMASMPRPTPATTLASETSHASHASDTQSIRSGTSFGAGSSYGGIARLTHPDMHGPEYGPGLHASIIETVSAVFQDGVAKSVKVTGEIAMVYNPGPDTTQPGKTCLKTGPLCK